MRMHQGRPVILFKGIGSMNDAELLAGRELRIAEAEGDAGLLEPGEYFHRDLIGCAVVTESGDPVGQVAAVEGDRGNTRLVVKSRRNEVLIPLADEICTMDLAAKRITVRPPEGLLELNGEWRAAEAERGKELDEDRRHYDLPADGGGGAGRRRRRPRAHRGVAGHRGPQPARLHDRQASRRGRCAVWRRAGHGDEARAVFCGARGDSRAARGTPDAVVLLSPAGERFTQQGARRLAAVGHLVLLCGRYEGIDERVREALATEEISIGDYVLSGGEVPALAVIDAVARLVPGVVGDDQSVEADSFTRGLLDYPHYTRPAEFEGRQVPDVLLSGHHGEIRRWRRETALQRTVERRPDLLADRGARCGRTRVVEKEQVMTAMELVEKAQLTERPRIKAGRHGQACTCG